MQCPRSNIVNTVIYLLAAYQAYKVNIIFFYFSDEEFVAQRVT